MSPRTFARATRNRKQEPSASWHNTALYAIALFVGAFLLFMVELIAGKALLPWFGGSAAVWTTCMLVFQILLLAGYAYSHLITARFHLRMQQRIHFVLLALAVVQVIGFGFWEKGPVAANAWMSASVSHPVAAVSLALLFSVGMPFFVLSGSGPLLQSWFVRLGGGQETYRLYSISNIGSLAGLLSFPLLLEPALGIRSQSIFWAAAFVLFALICLTCASRLKNAAVSAAASVRESVAGPAAGLTDYILWFLLATCACSLLLATTNLLCQEVTSLPLLWVLPLALYLLSFVICFDHPRWYNRAIVHPLYAAILLLAALTLNAHNHRAEAILLPLALLLTCLVCHGEISRSRPPVRQLTAFYLTICAGGAAGSFFVAILAPQVFSSFSELQFSLGAGVALLLVALFRDKESWLYRRELWLLPTIFAGAVLVAFWGTRSIGGISRLLHDPHYYRIAAGAGVATCVAAYAPRLTPAWKNRVRVVQWAAVSLALLIGALLYRSLVPEAGLILNARNFYGAIRVVRESHGALELVHGQTTHGLQLLPPNQRVPTAYYGPNSTIGIVLTDHPKRIQGGPLRVGVVGLGAGTLAAYGRPGDYFRFYEINPRIVGVASGPNAAFTYLRDSAATTEVLTGDARQLLDGEATRGELQNFDVLVLDAFSGDAIPVHLLTKEAFEIYFKHMATDGIIAVHLSSRHVNLEPVLHAVVEEFPVDGRATFSIEKPPFKSSLWMLFSAQHRMLEIRGLDEIGQAQRSNHDPVFWTDNYTSILPLLRP